MEVKLEQSTVIPEPRQAKKPRKKLVLTIGIVLTLVAVAVIAVFAYNASVNTYKTPIAIFAERENRRSYSSDIDLYYKALNGFAKEEAGAIMEVVTGSDAYKGSLEEEESFFNEAVGFNKKEYGSDYQIRFKIAGEEALDAAALEQYKDELKKQGQALEAMLGEETELNRSLQDYAKQLQSVEVTAGYALTVKKVITGSKLASPVIREETFTVYEVNGRWMIDETPILFASAAAWYAAKM